ncbi:MAG: hypothetical protein U0807_04445 [Candidatus Binatia bacterium]
MTTPRARVWLWMGLLPLLALGAEAASLRKQCKHSCRDAIQRCVAATGKKGRCKRSVLQECRQQGLDRCAAPSTSSTTTTTSTAVTSTTAGPGESTTTTSTTLPTVNGCSTYADRTGPSDARTITFTSYAYSPACMEVRVGQTIFFSGTFGAHPLVGGEIVGSSKVADPSSPIPATNSGTAINFSIGMTGTYPFYCDFHGTSHAMKGAIRVVP